MAFAAGVGVPTSCGRPREMALDAYRENDRDRCYWCKHTLFDVCE